MSQFHRAHPSEPHPFELQPTGGSWITQDERDEILADLREQSRRARMCIQCGSHDGDCPVCCGDSFDQGDCDE